MVLLGLAACSSVVGGPSLAVEAGALRQSAPALGLATSFAILGGSTVTNTGATTVEGDLGVSPGTALTGFAPGVPTGGVIHAGDALAALAKADLAVAYDDLVDQTCDV